MGEIATSFQQRLKHDLFRQFLRWRLAYEDEIRQPHFAEFLWIFDRQIVRKEWICRRCTNRRERMCIYGRQQGFQCLAYWWWQQPATPSQKILVQEIPLVNCWLQYLPHIQLLGIFYIRQFSLATVGDFSKVGLRTRLLQIQNVIDNEEDFL